VQATGTASENGTARRAAMAAITDAASDNGYLVQLEGGEYDLGTSSLTVKSWIHLRGAGTRQSVLRRTGGSSNQDAPLRLEADSLVSDLTAEHAGSADVATGLYADGAAEARDLRVVASGGSLSSTAIHLSGSGTTSTLRRCRVEASGSGPSGVRGITLSGAAGGLLGFARHDQGDALAAHGDVTAGSATAGPATPVIPGPRSWPGPHGIRPAKRGCFRARRCRGRACWRARPRQVGVG